MNTDIHPAQNTKERGTVHAANKSTRSRIIQAFSFISPQKLNFTVADTKTADFRENSANDVVRTKSDNLE